MVALKVRPGIQDVPVMIANVQQLFVQRRFDLVIAELGLLFELLPREPTLLNVAGAAHAGLGRLDEAIACYDAAILLNPALTDAHSNRGVALRDQGRLSEALASFDSAIELEPRSAGALANRGVVLNALGRREEALDSYDRSLALDPDTPATHYNRANALRDLRRLAEAVAAYDRAIARRPDFADAHGNRGNALQQLGRHEEAVASYDRAIAADPHFADAHINRGNVMHELKRMDDAADSYAEAIRLNPNHAEARARAELLKAHMCDWADRGGTGGGSMAALGTCGDAVPPFNMLVLDDDAARNLARSAKWTEANHAGLRRAALAPVKRSRIRVGYFSADFHSHATMSLIAGLLERHDRARFEIHAYSYGPDRKDAMRGRAIDAVDAFHDVRDLSDAGIAALAHGDGIDIAVDLKGYTQDSRAGIFAAGAAPLQVAYLGYPGSSGAAFIDYIVADRIVIPPGKRQHYSEKLICLPHSYQVNDNRRGIAGEMPTRRALGLPETGFVFCCFNNSYKISPEEFAIWMRLLSRVEGSVLWLLRDNDRAIGNLRRSAQAHGVAADRLVFAGRAPLADHLARHRCADLFLDTFVCNAHTTASDALWAGLPVLTKLGDGFAARVAGSLLHAIALPELVTETAEAYEQLAFALALDPRRLSATKAKLMRNRLDMPLFDTVRFVRHLEQGYARAFDRCLQGLPPDHIIVPPNS